MEFRLGSAAFILVFATYLFLGGMGLTDRGNPEPRDAAYNLLARGLLSGHLYLDKEPPPALAALADPYDPAANKAFRVDTRYRLHDLSYYRGRLYLYFGVAPALLIFIPWHLLTGAWLPHWVAVVLLCTGGLLVNLSLARALRAAAFPGSRPWTGAVTVLILGLGSYAPVLLSRADMWEVPIAFSYLALTVALRCLWEALVRPGRPAVWLALASAAMGAALASRPTVLPAVAVLAVPFLARETRARAANWAAALVPVALGAAGVGAYNALRFGNPLEFGTSFMLSGVYPARVPSFGAGYFWTNVRLDLFQGVDWSSVFPFAHEPEDWQLRANAGGTEHISGALLNSPVLWAGLAVPAFIRIRRPSRAFVLLAACAGWSALSAMTLLLFFCGANSRYQFEFVPGLALLASIGVTAMEGMLTGASRAAARVAWALGLLVSCAFPVLYGIDRCVMDHNYFGIACLARGDLRSAEREFGAARLLSPGNPFSRLESGVALVSSGRTAEAKAVFEALVRDFPGDALAHLNLANVLAGEGRLDEAIGHYRTALRLDPGNPVIKTELDTALSALARRNAR
jgi:hypothetical protein